MKRVWAGTVFLALMLTACALAQEPMRLFVAKGALKEQAARQLAQCIEEAQAGQTWEILLEEQTGESLRDMVMAGREPALAICAPGEALPFAREGLLLALQTRIAEQTRMQRQALDPCVWQETLFMAPLLARHRQMAVNARRFEARQLAYLLDERAHPVWYPTQLYQVLEEFMMTEGLALEVWLPRPGEEAGIEALVQAIYGGALLSEDGARCQADTAEMLAGVKWLGDMVECGLIGLCESREEALQNFLSGETVMFADWMPGDAARLSGAMEEDGILTMAYPSAIGLPVRAFELTGVCAFASGDAARDALAVQAAVLLHEDAQAQAILGSRAIWQDNAIWLPSLAADDRGATLRSLFGAALEKVLTGEESAEAALGEVQAAMEAMK